jgi:hypothetical protein
MRISQSNLNAAKSRTPDISRNKSDVLAAIMYAACALALAAYFRLWCRYWDSWILNAHEITALLSAVFLVAGSIGVIVRRSFADLSALLGALLAWSNLRSTVFSSYLFSPWLTFNMPGEDPDLSREFLLGALPIVLTGILGVATAFSVLRLTPRTWRFGTLPVRQRIWPVFAATILFVMAWYVRAVMPYQIPIFDLHDISPSIVVLHVEKHGLQFHETSLTVYRDAQFVLAQDDRKLFQYSFQNTVSMGVIPEKYFAFLHSLAGSPPAFVGRRFPYYAPPLTWNADRWFVEVGAGRKPIRMDASAMPKSILDLFHDVQQAPPERVSHGTRRDICFGFCYDPTY